MKASSILFGALGVLVLAGACGDDATGGATGDDGGSATGDDSGIANGDGAVVLDDAGKPIGDGATPTRDGATPIGDGGTPTSDGGTPTADSGTRTDSGTPPPDSGTPPPDSGTTGVAPVIGGCQVFPNNSPWNTPIDTAAINPQWSTYAPNMTPTRALHADWGDYSTNKYGIPWQTVPGTQVKVPMVFQNPAESDPGPYPFPLNAKIEAPSDSHALVLETGTCTLYETGGTARSGAGFSAYSGAKWDLHSNALRPDGWTSGDAAGLPILPGLVRLAEVLAGAVHHAIRFTMSSTQQGYIHPATHAAGSANAALPPMGLRMRLKASFDLSSFSGPALVILTAMKKYGLILADNGSSWYIGGDSDDGWTNLIDAINQSFARVHGSDFEAVDTGPVSTAGL